MPKPFWAQHKRGTTRRYTATEKRRENVLHLLGGGRSSIALHKRRTLWGNLPEEYGTPRLAEASPRRRLRARVEKSNWQIWPKGREYGATRDRMRFRQLYYRSSRYAFQWEHIRHKAWWERLMH